MNPGDILKEEVAFKVVSIIAAGTYGTVYKAVQEGVDRVVAIKELKSSDNRRLKQETWIQGGLIHPNIVTVFLYDEDHGYLVMEFVPSSLKEKIGIFQDRKQKFEEPQVEAIAKECLEALVYAHENGCPYHGDIKPGNILVTDDWHIKISDFGVARSFTTGPSDLSGSERWAAPETLRAWEDSKIWNGDEKSDLFSLGVILYTLLTGTNPFIDPSGVRQPRELVLDSNYIPEVPNTANPRLGQLTGKLISKEVRNRYKSARDALDDLSRIPQDSAPTSTP